MEDQVTTARLTRELAARHRVVLLGGLAVLSLGHDRPTYDADLWLDPELEVGIWVDAIHSLLATSGNLRIVAIGSWTTVAITELRDVIERDRVIRIMGANQPLDIFREPNELPMSEFDAVWERATPLDDGTRVPDVVDLLMTKQDTGRVKDTQDIAFLEAKAEQLYLEKLPEASASVARAMLERFLTPRVAEAAIGHQDESVRSLGMQFLRELSEEGDPFARDILDRINS
jgi:hypothetical protein